VGRRLVVLAVGGELGGGAALLRLAMLHLLNQLLPDELKFNAQIYVEGAMCHLSIHPHFFDVHEWLFQPLCFNVTSHGL